MGLCVRACIRMCTSDLSEGVPRLFIHLWDTAKHVWGVYVLCKGMFLSQVFLNGASPLCMFGNAWG